MQELRRRCTQNGDKLVRAILEIAQEGAAAPERVSPLHGLGGD